jgi:hypothetical protein
MKINFKNLFKKKEKIYTKEIPDYTKAFKDILESANLAKQYDNNRPDRICVKLLNDNIFLEIKSEEE